MEKKLTRDDVFALLTLIVDELSNRASKNEASTEQVLVAMIAKGYALGLDHGTDGEVEDPDAIAEYFGYDLVDKLLPESKEAA